MQMGYSPDQVIVAAVQMLREREFQYPLEEIRDVQERKSRRNRNRGNNAENSRSNDNRGGRKSRRKRQSDENMVRLRMDIGRSNGVKPGDVVYTVASTANIPGRVIGAIEIKQDTTFVDVPENHVNAVLSKMKRGKLRGQDVTLTRA